tara:strand:- start:596 stop:697 length:102 start_codon:yes stop_codon:yes gene_type:complete
MQKEQFLKGPSLNPLVEKLAPEKGQVPSHFNAL